MMEPFCRSSSSSCANTSETAGSKTYSNDGGCVRHFDSTRRNSAFHACKSLGCIVCASQTKFKQSKYERLRCIGVPKYTEFAMRARTTKSRAWIASSMTPQSTLASSSNNISLFSIMSHDVLPASESSRRIKPQNVSALFPGDELPDKTWPRCIQRFGFERTKSLQLTPTINPSAGLTTQEQPPWRALLAFPK